jgi:tol-pal system protein YbgF
MRKQMRSHQLVVMIGVVTLMTASGCATNQKEIARSQASLSADVATLRHEMMVMTGQVEEFNQRSVYLADRMEKLEKAFGEMSSVYRSEALEQSATTNMRLTKMEEELLRLSLETRAYIKLSEKKSGITSRAHNEEVASLAAEAGATPEGAKPRIILPTEEPDDLYREGYDLYLNGEYGLAIERFTHYLAKYPDTTLADNALYWLAESHYGNADYSSAIKHFERLPADYPASRKAAPALLRSADCFTALGESVESAVRLLAILKQYPTSDEAITASDRLDALPEKIKQRARSSYEQDEQTGALSK